MSKEPAHYWMKNLSSCVRNFFECSLPTAIGKVGQPNSWWWVPRAPTEMANDRPNQVTLPKLHAKRYTESLKETISFLKKISGETTKIRGDYRELVDLSLILLGEQDHVGRSYLFKKPAGISRARWMEWQLYASKWYIFHRQLQVPEEEVSPESKKNPIGPDSFNLGKTVGDLLMVRISSSLESILDWSVILPQK